MGPHWEGARTRGELTRAGSLWRLAVICTSLPACVRSKDKRKTKQQRTKKSRSNIYSCPSEELSFGESIKGPKRKRQPPKQRVVRQHHSSKGASKENNQRPKGGFPAVREARF